MATERQLRDRWETGNGRQRLKKVIAALQNGEDWTPILTGFPHVEEVRIGRDLRHADLSQANLYEGDLNGANLSEAMLRGADLRKAELRDADLGKADLRFADVRGADLRAAHLRQAELWGADLRKAALFQAELSGAECSWTDLRGANLDFAEMRRTPQAGNKPPRETSFARARFDDTTSFLAVRTNEVDWTLAARLKRHVEDQQWLYEWRTQSKWHSRVLYHLWSFTCDCGRSFLQWAVISLILALVFGSCFYVWGDRFNLSGCPGKTLWDAHPFMAMYYSVVTFTTLGFGDVTPKPDQPLIQLLVTLEVILGYIMLGGLVSILATKLARRS